MDLSKLDQEAQQKHRQLLNGYSNSGQLRHTVHDIDKQIHDLTRKPKFPHYRSNIPHKIPPLINQINNELSELQSDRTLAGKTNKKPANKHDYMSYVIKHMQNERKILIDYRKHIQNQMYIVLANWSINDLRDSNNDLINNDNLKSWRTSGCKVYGKLGDTNAENDYDNRGFFSHFNYPINIIKNPKTYYFSSKDLPKLYKSIGNHNPRLAPWLISMAKHGTIAVHTFKTRFGLSDRQIKARLAKAKNDALNGINNTTVHDLQNYYRWLLHQRKIYNYRDDSDLSEYDSDYDDSDEFNSDLKNYQIYGNGDNDDYNYVTSDYDATPSDYDDSDSDDGIEFDRTYSDSDYIDSDSDDPYSDEYPND